jgi:hypothetical protein
MPGTFAHILLVDSLCRGDCLDEIDELGSTLKLALTTNRKFCELGAVSPDYPYLVLLDKESAGWANVMHYWKTADFVRRAVYHLLHSGFGPLESEDAQRGLAWIFGYAAHVVADLTVHPVIECKVGPYEGHETAHRICEMHQDAHIFHVRLGKEIQSLEYIDRAGLRDCGERVGETDRLAPAIAGLWQMVLDEIPLPALAGQQWPARPQHRAEPDHWHHHYVNTIDLIGHKQQYLLLARGIAEPQGFIYPHFKDVEAQYVANLDTPANIRMSYTEIFERARQNILTVWRQIGTALAVGDPELVTLVNGNLDTGRADGTPLSGPRIFWTV